MHAQPKPVRENASTTEARLHDLKRALVQRGLKFPAVDGNPARCDTKLVAAMLGPPDHWIATANAGVNRAWALLNEMVAEVGLMSADDLTLAIQVRPLNLAPAIPVDTTAIGIGDWISKVQAQGLKVPADPKKPGKIAWSVVAKDAGVDKRSLSERPKYRKLIEAFAQQTGLMNCIEFRDAVTLANCASATKLDDRADKLRRHLRDEHLAMKRPLPENPKRAGRVHLRRVFQAAGLQLQRINDEAELIQIVECVAQMVGIGPDAYRPAHDAQCFTYADLRRVGEACVLLEDADLAESTHARFGSALSSWMKEAGRSTDDAVGSDFSRTEFAERLEQAARRFENPTTRKRWVSNMERWRRYACTFANPHPHDLPADFAGAVRWLMRKAAYSSLADLVANTDLAEHSTIIRSWLAGAREPLSGEESIVQSLEARLNAPTGALSTRVEQVRTPTRRSYRPETWPPSLCAETPGDKRSEGEACRLRRFAMPLLPTNFQYLSMKEREAIGTTIKAEYVSKIQYRKEAKHRRPWRLRPIPDRLNATWERAVAYKTDAFPEFDRIGRWRPATSSRAWGALHEFFSFLALPVDEGGAGILPSQMTFALLACPAAFKIYGEWKLKKGGGRLNSGARSDLGILGHLTTPDVRGKNRRFTGVAGFLHFIPDLAFELEPIAGIVTADELSALQTPDGWSAALTKFNDAVWRLWRDHENNLFFSRDPFDPIRPILDLDQPSTAIYQMLHQATRDLPDPQRSSPYRRAIALRRLVGLLVVVETALRRRNVVSLTYDQHNTGQFRRTPEGWRIELPASEFKNSQSSFFGVQQRLGRDGGAYQNTLPAEFTQYIDEYVYSARPMLLRGKTSNSLFIGRRGEPLAFSLLWEEFSMFTWKYLVFHETTGTGIPGVERFGPHAIRNIIVTDILKNTGDSQLAADAIQDTVETVVSMYAHVQTAHKIARVARFRATRRGAGIL